MQSVDCVNITTNAIETREIKRKFRLKKRLPIQDYKKINRKYILEL